MASDGLDNKVGNVMGVPLPLPVRVQFQMRSAKNMSAKETGIEGAYDFSRDTDNIKYLANKTGWVRLVSSVDVIGNDLEYFKTKVPYLFANTIGLQAVGINIKDKVSLAKAFVLSAGTSIYQNEGNGFSYAFREGLEGATAEYGNIAGMTEVKEYGYRPMPGITDVQIQTQGRLGSIRQATINFKVWTKDQLDIIDTLYFKMGYHMFLEWGHMYYYDMTGKLNQMGPTIDPFAQNLTKEQLLINIAKKKDETNCNYDAMIGMCTHFTFTFNQEGGYDCTIKLIGLGTLADSMKINSISGIPDIQQKEIQNLYNTFKNYKREQIAAERGSPPPELAKKPESAGQFLASGSINDSNKENYRVYSSKQNVSALVIPQGQKNIPNGGIFLEDRAIYIPADSDNEKQWYTSIIMDGQLLITVRDKMLAGIDEPGSTISMTNRKLPGNNLDINAVEKDYVIKSWNNPGEGIQCIEYLNFFDSKTFIVILRYLHKGYNYDIVLDITNPDNQFFSYQDITGADYWKVYKLSVDGGRQVSIPNPNLSSTDNLYGVTGDYSKADAFNELSRVSVSAVEYCDTILKDYLKTFVPSSKPSQVNLRVGTPLVTNSSIQGPCANEGKVNKYILFDLAGNRFSNAKNAKGYTLSIFYGNEYGFRNVQQPRKLPKGIIVDTPVIGQYAAYLCSNDIALIQDIIPTSNALQEYQDKKKAQADAAAAKAAQEQYAKEQEEIKQQVDAAVKEEGFKYASAIESALRIIQIHSLNEAVGNPDKPEFDFREIKVSNLMQPQAVSGSIAEAIFANSLFKDKIKDFVNNSNLPSDKVSSWVLQGLKPSANKQDRLKSFTAYGFNHNLMASQNPEQFVYDHELKTCDFEGMFKSYVVPYDISTEVLKNIDSNHPVYIRFDLLLFLLNSMSLLYDSPGSPRSTKVLSQNKTQNTDVIQTPLLYIDFNTHTNTCLSAPIQMSIDVLKFLIPFRGTAELYKTLFNDEHLKAIDEESKKSQASKNEDSDTEIDKDLASQVSNLFDPANKDAISASLPEFKSTENADKAAWYGKIMNVVVGIDYLLSVFQQHSANDDSHSVNLRPFIQQILADMNKSFGDINYFRFGYKDESNCMYIADDQSSPLTCKDEKSPTVNMNQKSTGKYGDLEFDNNSIELPLYGRRSIAKSIEIRTEVSSKLSNMLAISANADKKSAAGKNSTAFGQYNENYINRYVEQSTEPNIDAKKILEGEKNAAIAFNDYVVSIFSQDNPKFDQTDSAMNYYIERMNSKVAEYQATRASAMIPVSVNFQTDGISGVSMGQAFTLPEQLLPRTYQRYENENGVRVGFVMTGVQESISSNIWNTTIKANMFFMKKESDYKIDKKLYNINPLSQSIFEGQSNIIGNNGGSSNTNFTGNNADARKAIETYIGRAISDTEFKDLISATFAEASANQKERAWVMGTMLNRSRNSGASISVELRKPNQFQSVTGTAKDGHRASPNFINGPPASSAQSIYGAAINILSTVPKNIINFTAANLNAYGPGTNPGYITTLKNRGGVVIGQTIFST